MTAVLVSCVVLLGGTALAQVPTCVPPPAGMVAWWPADGIAVDLVRGNAGTLVGGATFAMGRVDQAFSLNGTDAWVEVPDSASLRVSGQITIDAWIFPTALGGRVVDKIIAGTGDGYLLDTWGGVVRVIAGSRSASGTTALPTGAWTHVAGVYDGTQARVYVNGVLDGTFDDAGSIPVNSLPLRIGADSDGQSRFSGLIDEVEVFNRALSQAEIQAIAAAGSAGKCKDALQVVPTLSPSGIALLAALLAAGAIRVLRLQAG